MGRDFTATVFYGFFVESEEAKTIEQKYSSEGEEDGWFMLLEMLEKEKNPVEVFVAADGVEDGGVRDYRLALAVRKSLRRMYVNENNEIHKVKDLTVSNGEWDGVLKKFCSGQGITFAAPEWWLCTEGE